MVYDLFTTVSTVLGSQKMKDFHYDVYKIWI